MVRFACAILLAGSLACDSDSAGSPDAADRDAAGSGTRDAAAGGARDAAQGGERDAESRADAGGKPVMMDADAGETPADDAGPAELPARFQVFSRTTGFRHDSIEVAQAALARIAARRGASLQVTEDPAVLIARLPQTDAVVFLMTTGDVLDAPQQQAFERFIRSGGGFVGVHSSADTEYDWPFYGELNGAWFADHPAIQKAKLIVDAPNDSRVSFLPQVWERTDEWYNFRDNPRGRVTVLLRLDETSYSGGKMGGDHPIAWSRAIDRGRSFYTGLGHTKESWSEPLFVEHVERGLFWAGGR